MAVSPGLWPSITDALDQSEYFILLASPGAAESEWVNREIEHWMASRPDAGARVLPVLTEGTWVWDKQAGEIDWDATTAAPRALAGVFTDEPRHLDLAWARSRDDLDLHNPKFRDAVADLAAPLHGIPKDELEGEDVRQHRRALLIRRTAVAALALLVVGLGIAGVLAQRSAEQARTALSDLEDANGNIDELTAEGVALQAANAAAEQSLEETEAQRVEAEALAAEAQAQAETAETARAEADAARATAETARAEAIAAQSAAETARDVAAAAQVEAERAQVEAEAAQATAETDRDAAQRAATAAGEAERRAQRAETVARAAEKTARDGEATAKAAEEDAKRKEEAAVAAEAAAKVGQQRAEDAEAAAKAAEQAAKDAADVAEAAAQVAVRLRQEADAAALFTSLARNAAEASDPALAGLLAVESYCALEACEVSGDETSSGSAVGALRRGEPMTARSLETLTPMLNTVNSNPDYLGSLHGMSARAIDVAISADGQTVAALGDDGVARIWHPGAPDGEDFELVTLCDACANDDEAVSIAVSGDGSTLAYATVRRFDNTEGAVERLHLIDIGGVLPPDSVMIQVNGVQPDLDEVELDFHPTRNDLVLIVLSDPYQLSKVTVYNRAVPTAWALFTGGIEVNVHNSRNSPPWETAAWTADGQLAMFGRGTARLVTLDDTCAACATDPLVYLDGTDVDTDVDSVPVTARATGDSVLVGFDDGQIRSFDPAALTGDAWTSSRDLPGEMQSAPAVLDLKDLEVSSDDSTLIWSTTTRSVSRSGIAGRTSLVATSPAGVVEIASAHDADRLVVAIDGHVELRTATSSRLDGVVRPRVVGSPSVDGVLQAPEGNASFGAWSLVRNSGVVESVQSARWTGPLVSEDGSTVLVPVHLEVVKYDADGPDVIPLLAPGIDTSVQQVSRGAISPDGSVAAVVFTADNLSETVVLVFETRRGTLLRAWAVPATCSTDIDGDEIKHLVVSASTVVVHVVDWCPSRSDFDAPHVLGLGVSTGDDRDFEVSVPFERRFGAREEPAVLAIDADRAQLLAVDRRNLLRVGPLSGGPMSVLLDVGRSDRITSIAVPPAGGEFIVIGFESGRAQLWSRESRSVVLELAEHEAAVRSAVVGHHDGQLVVATRSGLEWNRSGTAIVQTLSDADATRRLLCDRAGRDLTREEWANAGGDGEPATCLRGLS